MKGIIIFLCCSMLSFGVSRDYKGYWTMPDGRSNIQIVERGGEYIGYLRWIDEIYYLEGDPMEGREQVDRKNPNTSLQDRKILDLQVIGGLKEGSKGLEGGWMYDVWSGKTYYLTIKMKDHGTAHLRVSKDRFGIIGKTIKVKRIYMN